MPVEPPPEEEPNKPIPRIYHPPSKPPEPSAVEPPPTVDPSPSPMPDPPAPVPATEIGARALWTLAEVVVAAGVAWVAGLTPEDDPAWFTAIVAIGSPILSAIKSFIGTKVGNPDTVTFK